MVWSAANELKKRVTRANLGHHKSGRPHPAREQRNQHKDKTDVIELITRRKLPRDLPVSPVIRTLYTDTWDALQAEK